MTYLCDEFLTFVNYDKAATIARQYFHQQTNILV